MSPGTGFPLMTSGPFVNRRCSVTAEPSSYVDPTPVLDLMEAFRRSKVMFAAVGLGVFERLVAGPAPVEVLARDLKADRDGLERLLDTCVGLQLLTKEGAEYANTPLAATYLCGGSPRQMTGYINFSNDVLWKLWDHLEDAVREGSNRFKQAFGWDGPMFANIFRTEGSKREFSLGMHGFGQISSPEVVAAFDLSRFQALVDLGGATGHLAIAACQRYSTMRAVVFDLPEVIPLAREKISEAALDDRLGVVGGDFFADPLPAGDLYALGRILHDWPREKIQELLARIYSACRTTGLC